VASFKEANINDTRRSRNRTGAEHRIRQTEPRSCLTARMFGACTVAPSPM